MQEKNFNVLNDTKEKYYRKSKYIVLLSAVIYGIVGYLIGILHNASFEQFIYSIGFFSFFGIFMGYFAQNELEEKRDILNAQVELFKEVIRQKNSLKEESGVETSARKNRRNTRVKTDSKLPPSPEAIDPPVTVKSKKRTNKNNNVK